MVTVRASTAEAFEATVSHSFVPLSVTRLEARVLRATVEQKEAESAAITLVRSDPVSVKRTQRLIERSERGVVLLMMQLRGTSVVAQGGVVSRLRPGQGALYFSDRPYDLLTQVRSEVVVFHAPLAVVGLRESQVAAIVPRVLDARTDSGFRVVRHLSRSFLGALPVISDAREMGRITTGLVATMIGDRGSRRAELDHPALFAAVSVEIDRRLGDPSLSVASLARAHGVSVRAVHECFEDRGLTPAAVFREKRLALAVSLLRSTDLPLAQVAASVGMLDPSTLTRALRRAMGATAREIRASRRGAGAA